MARNETISDAVRRALITSGLSMYRVSAESEVCASQLSRFLSGEVGLTLDTLDKLQPVLQLRLVVEPTTKKRDKKKGR